MSRRRRGILLAGLALLLGALAASDVAGRESALRRRMGPLVDVVVARRALPAGARVRATALALRRVPARFAPRDAVAAPAAAVGLRVAVAVPAGADVPASALGDGRRGGPGAPVGRGERVADVVAVGSAQAVVPGAHVDVLVTRDGRGGAAGATSLALEDVEVLAAATAQRPAGATDTAPRVAASLRVTLRQAVFLAAAQSFAREIRLLPRAAGDRGHSAAGVTVTSGL